jgi:uncharacterized membrane protein
MRRALRRLRRERRASVSVLVAVCSVVLLGFLGLVIDLGDLNDAHRQVQGTADLAAVAAASNLTAPTAAANAVALANGYGAAAVTAVVTGTYTPNPRTPITQRFAPSSTNVNAVQVTMNASQSFFLSGIYNLAGRGPTASSAAVGAQATAVNVVQGSFTVGSALASFNGGIINGVLGGMFNSNISLSVADYQALIGGQIDLFQFANALATELNVTAGTYSQLLSGSVTVGQFVQALQIAGAASSASTALADLTTALGSDTQTINLSQLLNLGDFMNNQIGTATGMTAAISASQLVSLAGQLAGGGRQIAINLATGIPGIAGVTGLMTVGEPPVGTTMITVGNAGASVHTAQVRLLLTVTLGSTLLGATVQLPLYLELASATASLTSISCNVLDTTNASVTLAVTPSLASLWIGSVSAPAMANFSAEPSPAPAPLVTLSVLGLGTVTVNGFASARISNLQPTTLMFNNADIQSDLMQATDTQDYFASLFATALGQLQLSATMLGLAVAVPNAASQLGNILAAASGPADQLVTDLLQSLGIGLGVADAWVGGLRCAPAVLAQ